jgi:RNA polymerase sigma-70 factor, ECF subfamily
MIARRISGIRRPMSRQAHDDLCKAPGRPGGVTMRESDDHLRRDDLTTDAFVEHLVRHRHALYAFIAKLLVNHADVEDVFQRTSLILWKKIGDFEPDGSFFHWACGIAFNEVRNYLVVKRRDRLHFDADLVELLATEAAAERERSEARLMALRACVARLSPRQQEILRQCYAGGATISDVAGALGRERGALYKQLARLRATLADCIHGKLARGGGVS